MRVPPMRVPNVSPVQEQIGLGQYRAAQDLAQGYRLGEPKTGARTGRLEHDRLSIARLTRHRRAYTSIPTPTKNRTESRICAGRFVHSVTPWGGPGFRRRLQSRAQRQVAYLLGRTTTRGGAPAFPGSRNCPALLDRLSAWVA